MIKTDSIIFKGRANRNKLIKTPTMREINNYVCQFKDAIKCIDQNIDKIRAVESPRSNVSVNICNICNT